MAVCVQSDKHGTGIMTPVVMALYGAGLLGLLLLSLFWLHLAQSFGRSRLRVRQSCWAAASHWNMNYIRLQSVIKGSVPKIICCYFEKLDLTGS